MRAGEASDALGIALDHEPVPAAQRVAGEPSTGWTALGAIADGWEFGVWEMTPGTMSDLEVEELSIVLAGRATVEFADGRPPIELSAGSVLRFADGTETVWTVHETLRKVYLIPADPAAA